MPSIPDHTSFYHPLLLDAGFTPGPSILYVEDDRLLKHALVYVLELAGYHIETCSDAGLAVGLMEYRKHYDLLLLDNELRCLTGLELIRRARKIKHLKETPIILISVEDCGEAARAAGANEFLRKQNRIVDLLDAVRRLLAAPKAKSN